MSVTFCKLGRNVRLVLLLAWETLFPTCRPLPVSSQTRDMVSILIFLARALKPRPEERRPLAARAPPVNVAPPVFAATHRQDLRYTFPGTRPMRAVLLILII